MPVIGELATLITARTAPFERGMRSVRNSIGQTRSRLQQFSTSVAGLTAGFVSAAGAATVLRNSLRLHGEFESARVSFELLLGSLQEGEKVLEGLAEFGAKTPFQLGELVKAGRGLAAFGVAADELIPTLRVLGDLSAGLGIRIEELAEIYGKAKVQGRLFMEDINQLQGRGIPVVQALAVEFGVAEESIRGMVSAGEIGFTDLRNALIGLTTDGGQFGGMMERQSQTFNGAVSNLVDSFENLQRNLGRSLDQFSDLTGKIQALSGIVSDLDLAVMSFFGTIQASANENIAKIAGVFATFFEKLDKTMTEFRDLLKSIPGVGRLVRSEGAIDPETGQFFRQIEQDLRGQNEEFFLKLQSEILRREQPGSAPEQLSRIETPIGAPAGAFGLGLGLQFAIQDLTQRLEFRQLESTDPFGDLFPDFQSMLTPDELTGPTELDFEFARFQEQLEKSMSGGPGLAGAALRGSAEAERILAMARGGTQNEELAVQREQLEVQQEIAGLFGTDVVTVTKWERF